MSVEAHSYVDWMGPVLKVGGVFKRAICIFMRQTIAAHHRLLSRVS